MKYFEKAFKSKLRKNWEKSPNETVLGIFETLCNLIQMHICSLITNLVLKGLLTDSLSLYQKTFFSSAKSRFVQCTFLTKLISALERLAGGERQLYQLATSFYTDFRLKGSLTQGVFDIHLIALVIVRNDK